MTQTRITKLLKEIRQCTPCLSASADKCKFDACISINGSMHVFYEDLSSTQLAKIAEVAADLGKDYGLGKIQVNYRIGGGVV